MKLIFILECVQKMTKISDAISVDAKERLKKYEHQEGITYCLHEKNIAFSNAVLSVITEFHEEGYSWEEISKKMNRDILEILVALLHQMEQGLLTRPIAYRKK